MNVQRLENEDFQPIISPRAPANLNKTDLKKRIKNSRDGSTYWQNYKKTMINFSQMENQSCSDQLNELFGWNTKVIFHKNIYFVIEIPSENASQLYKLISLFMIPSFYYKLPVL